MVQALIHFGGGGIKERALKGGQKHSGGVAPPRGRLRADAGVWPFKTDKESFVGAERVDGCALHFPVFQVGAAADNKAFVLPEPVFA